MDRISARALPVAIRLIREPVVVTYSYPRSHPLYGAGEECGVFVPMAEWKKMTEQGVSPGPRLPDVPDTDMEIRIKT